MRSTYINLRKYIAALWGVSFDEAYKIFSRKSYCQFNILANFAMKFESDRYMVCEQNSQSANLVSVCQNGCPNTRDIIIGGINSFNINENEFPKYLKARGYIPGSNNKISMLNYNECMNDSSHMNNFSFFLLKNPCKKQHMVTHYQNVYRDINILPIQRQVTIKQNFLNFLNTGIHKVIIKPEFSQETKTL